MNTIKTKGAEERKGRKKQYLSFIDFCVMNEENGFYSVYGVWCGAVVWLALLFAQSVQPWKEARYVLWLCVRFFFCFLLDLS